MKQNIKTMKLFSLFITAAFLFTSCVKEGDSPITSGKLKKIEYDGGSYETIDYNNDGTIGKITNHVELGNSAPDHVVYTFTYSSGLISELNGTDGSKFKYTYDNRHVIKTEVFSAGGNLSGYYQYTYVGDKISKMDAFFRFPGQNIPTTPTMRYENEYYENGNLKKITLYYPTQGGNLKKSNEFHFSQYDNKSNTSILFENNPFLPLENFVQNNPTKEIHLDANGNVEETIETSYTYDNYGNPLTRKAVSKATGQAEHTENTRFYY